MNVSDFDLKRVLLHRFIPILSYLLSNICKASTDYNCHYYSVALKIVLTLPGQRTQTKIPNIFIYSLLSVHSLASRLSHTFWVLHQPKECVVAQMCSHSPECHDDHQSNNGTLQKTLADASLVFDSLWGSLHKIKAKGKIMSDVCLTKFSSDSYRLLCPFVNSKLYFLWNPWNSYLNLPKGRINIHKLFNEKHCIG